MSAYSRILKAARSMPWAIVPGKLEAILGFLELKAAGGTVSVAALDEIRAESEIKAARAQTVSASSSGSVQVIPVYGCIMPRANLMAEISGGGGASIEMLTKQVRQAANDPNIRAIVLDFDSPGGSVEGVQELGAEILAARAKKKITAVSDYQCASAAYWLAACCTEIVASPSSLTGSIGVYMAHEDDSELLAKEGVKVTLIHYGANKVEGNQFEPLPDSARAYMQSLVDEMGLAFEQAVAKGRGVPVAKVQELFGQGRQFTAEAAKRIGMVDKVGTLDDVLAQYGVKRDAGANARTGAAETPAMADATGDPAELAAERDEIARRIAIATA